MRLGGRAQAAIEILDDLATRPRPVSVALRDWGTNHRFAGSKDRSSIGNLVYDAMRKRLSHGFAMQSDSGRALVISVLVRDWGVAPDAISAEFDGDRFAPERLTDQEIALLENPDPLSGAPDHVRADLPEWLVPQFKAAFGETWIQEGQGLATRPGLDLRVNALTSTRERVIKRLKRFSPAPAPIAPDGLRIPSGDGDTRTPNVQADEAYQKGWVEIQDEGSQIVSLLAGAKPGDQVLDLCAGGGGKTLALAAQMQNRGQLFAYDADYHRLAPIYERLKRNQVRNCQVRKPEPASLDDLEGKMDLVLVDAPCTGTGTWRRHPDTKWRLTPDQVAARVGEQADLLEQAASFVKPGGNLVYITCSVLAEENSQQIEGFIEKSGIFSPADSAALWSAAFPSAPLPAFSNAGITLSPARTQTDGFFISVLTRAATA
ncbi:MAG: RsmB/NOP family class I SAM-dependent RNA methyltransferase [Hyphomicrobiaceae bacterium]|nr:RsmB/NOP family class I SAM-dependent RNA methyltransferase [Hyphomicrobiaceae bacterium]MCC0024658.1 RsmB/NOP family class I SAM-dependent RNA methyltransferase [Hyphomicrobiaceae bacterium]